ncbi:MAG TPA: hypothetical protein VJQ54_18930, partial [Candidatus Sulfotelmatobacter sp.]|nr:hypothetical protein [Candidatus Sulfotelmatobacter sp.]
YNGLTYSTWEVNPPNPTGYAPTMMVTCMNDPGTGPTPDPLYNPQYSDFCYEIPFMPGQTQYMDTPVVPTSAFAGAGYNNPDCSYPDLTPAIASVLNTNAEQGLPALSGPWVSAAGGTHSLTINSLGKQDVPSYAYAGPSATTSPFNQKKVTRNYGFGGTKGTVTIGGVDATAGIISWSDSQIVVTVPSGLPPCGITQQAQYGGSAASCGELVITAAGGQQSVDTVTVTVGGKQPTLVTQTIQSAIDAASPGDMIIVPPGTYQELLLMWKPVRLQGVGAASSIINANTQPAGKLDPWRSSVNCLFGLARNGQPNSGGNPFDPTGVYSCPTPSNSNTGGGIGPDGNVWNYFYGGPNYPTMVVDRIPLEGILGWDATVNGNLAEQLQEPSIMGAYEGAGITVLSKGVNIPANSTDIFGSGAEASFPTGTALLTANSCTTSRLNQTNPFPSNFQCNPSSIDGLGITNSSQGGGGVFVHAWAHNLQIANNRVYSNAGTLSGGLAIGQGESPEAYLNGTAPDTDPGSCISGTGLPANTQLPYCLNLNVNIHNNNISHNSSTGDELFSGTPAGAGGISICTGADYYKFNYNWVCGNLSTGDGGGIGHLGFSYYGDIEHNSILFNQSTNPTIPANGGGLIIMGAAPDTTLPNGTECGSVTDNDCVPGLSDGTGPGLVINANLIMGNAADSGTGGGLRFQAVNGTDIARFPTPTSGLSRGANCSSQANCDWYVVSVTNNIIADNVAGWDGAGVSLEDSLVVNFVNNTVSSNDTTASSGVLFNTLGAPLASSQAPPPNCPGQASGTGSCAQPAGLVALQNSPQLTSSFTTGPITCPAGHPNCTKVSYPLMFNDVFWQNRAFTIQVGSLGPGTLNQQNVVTLVPNFSQPTTDATTAGVITGGTGACVSGANYWDIGFRGDTGVSSSPYAYHLNPTNSVLTSGYTGNGNSNNNPAFISQYCNGSRVPPEATCKSVTGATIPCGYQAPAGIADATVPNPIFNLTPAATVDEGNNWINLSWGPLALTHPVSNQLLGNYGPTGTSSVIDHGVTSNSNVAAPTKDFFDHTRTGTPDIGAVEFGAGNGGGGGATASLTPVSHDFGTHARTCPGTTFAQILACFLEPTQTFTLTNTGSVTITGIGAATIVGNNPTEFAIVGLGTTCGTSRTTLAPGAACTVVVQFKPQTNLSAGAKSATLSISDSAGTQTSSLSGTANP